MLFIVPKIVSKCFLSALRRLLARLLGWLPPRTSIAPPTAPPHDASRKNPIADDDAAPASARLSADDDDRSVARGDPPGDFAQGGEGGPRVRGNSDSVEVLLESGSTFDRDAIASRATAEALVAMPTMH